MITERDFWNHRSHNYDEQIGPLYERAYQLTAERTLAYLKPEDRVLDFACGTGIVTLEEAPHVKYVRAIDISDEMVANEPDFGQVLPEFLTFAGDDILVGHNIQTFDMKFLYRDCERLFQQKLTNDYVDTLRVAKLCFPEWRHRRLSDLAEHYGISTRGAHRALTDCKMNQQVFEYLAKELEKMPAGKKQSKEKICPECGLPMKKRNGRFGEFWGCTGYPDCRHTENT